MNEHLFTNNDGLRLITQFEGAPRLKARRCEGGAWELSYGVTFYADGSPVREGDACTEDEAMGMFRHALQVFEDAVKRLVTVPLNSNQFSALVAFCYNVGEANLASSTVLKETNAGRFDDAAAAFGMWVFATLDGYKQALRGLLRRRYAEASLFLGYDWVEACADEAIALQREKPASLPGKDRVIYKTPFKDVLRVAQRYPLAALPNQPEPALANVAPAPDSARAIPDTPAAPASPVASAGTQGPEKPPSPTTPASPASQNPAPSSVTSGPAQDGVGVVASSVPSAPPPVVQKVEAPKPPPAKPPSPMLDVGPEPPPDLRSMVKSRRFWGQAIHSFGHIASGFGVTGMPGPIATSVGKTYGVVVTNPFLFEMAITGAVLTTGYIMVVGGAWIRKWGEKKAKAPLGTSKEVAQSKAPPK